MEATGFANSPRIEIDDSIQANFRDLKLWCFSFDLRNPVTHHEKLGAVLTVKKETRGGNYFFKLGKSTPDSLWEGSAQLNALAGGQTDPYTASPTGYGDAGHL